MKKRILVISPHPDDLDFGCSGTIAKLTEERNKVSYLIVSDGSKGNHKIKVNEKKLVKIRKEEQKKAAGIVGVKEVFFLGEKDGEIENTKSLRKKLVRLIRKIKPDIIFSFDPANKAFDNFYRYHRDHRMTAEAVFDAVYPALGSESFFPELLKQGYKPHQIKEVWFFATQKPNKLVNISRTIKRKIKALSCHQSQIAEIKTVEKRIKEWARKVGGRKYLYAEGFRVVKL